MLAPGSKPDPPPIREPQPNADAISFKQEEKMQFRSQFVQGFTIRLCFQSPLFTPYANGILVVASEEVPAIVEAITTFLYID